jgi:3-isopropylmalate/(R)-2-methylmalate dehydratase small subunit
MDKVNIIKSKPIAILADNIDTDIIIPKQFLKLITKTGLGKYVFNDWRYDATGGEYPDFELNKPENKDRTVLIAGENFGIGSSREHAVWALMDWGIKAVIAGDFSGIFYNNSIKNGLLPIRLEKSKREVLAQADEITINLEQQIIDIDPAPANQIDLSVQDDNFKGTTSLTRFIFEFDAKWKDKLLNGLDDIAETLKYEELITQYEEIATPFEVSQ